METDKVIVHGGGGHARVVVDCLLSQGRQVEGLFDPRLKGEMFGAPYLGGYDPDVFPEALAIVAIGDNATRKRAVLATRHRFTNVIHPSVICSPFVTVGIGCMLLHGVIVQAKAVLGNHIILNTGARIDHDNVLGDFVHVAPGAVLCGSVQVGEGTLIGAGAVVIPGVRIGAWVTIGAGAVVIDDIPDHAVVVGNPARIIRTAHG